jgi:hypothetical protein
MHLRKNERLALAYIILRLTTRTKPSSVFDHEGEKHFPFSGEVSTHEISVFDPTGKNIISGTGAGVNYSLLFSGDKTHINFSLIGNQFTGQNLDSGIKFSGKVNGVKLSLVEHNEKENESRSYVFSI